MGWSFGFRGRALSRRAGWTVVGLAAVVFVAMMAVPRTSALAADPPSTIWPTTVVPATLSDPDASRVELGVEFTAATAGWVTDLEFYKSGANGGPHVGHLWSPTGTLLAEQTYPTATASGWQRLTLKTPVKIAAGQKYVASYVAPKGKYSVTQNYFAGGKTVSNAGLTALRGVYNYSPGFPSATWQNSNYWVDLGFTTKAPVTTPTTSTPTTTGKKLGSSQPAASARANCFQ